jgi:hypothetical protein
MRQIDLNGSGHGGGYVDDRYKTEINLGENAVVL